MATVRLDLEYDGSQFAGWAAQPDLRTVEGVLRDALRVVVRGEVTDLRVAGRTDAGVSASAQVVSLVLPDGFDSYRLREALNGTLPDDVAVQRVTPAPPGFDARSDALSRAYEYRLLLGPRSPLRREHVLRIRGVLDIAAMREAASRTVGQHDFTAFTPKQTDHVFFHRTVLVCEWQHREDELVFVVEANAFLRNMVRVLAGTMMQVGRGAMSVDRYAALLQGAPREAAGPTAPPHPLTLVAVRYPSV